MKFTNPWINEKGFIDLGPLSYTNTNKETSYFDLYALDSNPKDIQFGARYQDEPSGYLSGSAFFNSDGVWELYCGGYALTLAAARYFANFHNKK